MATQQAEKAAPTAHSQGNRPEQRASEEDARGRLLAGIPVTERRLELAGISTAILEGGEGPPIVLMHGPGESAANWRWVMADLVDTHHVIAPDLPAHGATAGSDEVLDADRVLAWLGELVERIKSERLRARPAGYRKWTSSESEDARRADASSRLKAEAG